MGGLVKGGYHTHVVIMATVTPGQGEADHHEDDEANAYELHW
jgi:hypothetical protein